LTAHLLTLNPQRCLTVIAMPLDRATLSAQRSALNT
jgi:hypothetical protein